MHHLSSSKRFRAGDSSGPSQVVFNCMRTMTQAATWLTVFCPQSTITTTHQPAAGLPRPTVVCSGLWIGKAIAARPLVTDTQIRSSYAARDLMLDCLFASGEILKISSARISGRDPITRSASLRSSRSLNRRADARPVRARRRAGTTHTR